MAVWTPGSYLVREFSRHVEVGDRRESRRYRVACGEDGEESLARRDWWRADGDRVVPRLRPRDVGANQWIESDFAFVNGAATFLTLAGRSTALGADESARPHEVSIVPPSGWMRSITALDPIAPAGHDRRIPTVRPTTTRWSIRQSSSEIPSSTSSPLTGFPMCSPTPATPRSSTARAAVKDLEAIVRAHKEFWGSLPYPRYVFINLITEAGGGLEHARSSVLMASRWATRRAKPICAGSSWPATNSSCVERQASAAD